MAREARWEGNKLVVRSGTAEFEDAMRVVRQMLLGEED